MKVVIRHDLAGLFHCEDCHYSWLVTLMTDPTTGQDYFDENELCCPICDEEGALSAYQAPEKKIRRRSSLVSPALAG